MFARNLYLASYFLLSALSSRAFALELEPIPPVDIGLSGKRLSRFGRRDVDTSGLDLLSEETFLWGGTGANAFILANLTTFYPGDQEYVISMERFAGLLESADCTNGMKLTFNDAASFDTAQAVWNWVNDDVNNTFIMITDASGCAPFTGRQPFLVQNIGYDETNFVATLDATPQDWQAIAHSYHLSVTHHSEPPARLSKRIGKDITLDVGTDFSQSLFSTNINGVDLSVDCSSCGTEGSLNADFEVDVGFFKVNSANLKVTPSSLAAFVEIGLTAKGTLAEGYAWEKTLVSVPLEGFEIPSVCKLGGFLDVAVGFDLGNLTAEATLSMGAKMHVPDDSVFSVDLINSDNNQFSGWEPTFERLGPTLTAKISATVEVYAKPNVKLAGLNEGKGFDVGLDLKL